MRTGRSVLRRVHIENAAAQGVFSGHFHHVRGVVADGVEVREQVVDVEGIRPAAQSAPGRRNTRPNAGEERRRRSAKPRKTPRPVAIFHKATARSSWISGCGEGSGTGSTSWLGSETTESGSAAPVSSQKACSTGTRSSAARLSATTIINGRPADFCSRTKSKAFAVGISPETRIRPVPSLRWEATREKAGSFSTSVKRSRTKGRTMQSRF